MDRFKEATVAQLRAFCECVRHGSYSAAARALHRSQPAVWQQVRALERLAGVPLLEREGRALRPTEDGALFWEQAHTVLGNMDSLWASFHERRAKLPRRLTVVATPALLSEELVRPIVDFHRRYPDVTLRLQSQHSGPILDWLIRGDADLAIVPDDVVALADPAQFHREQIGRRIGTLLVAENHPLARRRRLTWSDLVREPLLLPLEDNPWFVQVEAVWRRVHRDEGLRCRIRIGHIRTAQVLVAEGLGPALMPMPERSRAVQGVCHRPLPHLLPDLPLYLLVRRGVPLRPAAEAFIECVRACLQPATG